MGFLHSQKGMQCINQSLHRIVSFFDYIHNFCRTCCMSSMQFSYSVKCGMQHETGNYTDLKGVAWSILDWWTAVHEDCREFWVFLFFHNLRVSWWGSFKLTLPSLFWVQQHATISGGLVLLIFFFVNKKTTNNHIGEILKLLYVML